MPHRTTHADLLARALKRAGARRAFGIAGGEILELIAALERQGIRYLSARHEQAIGFLAEGSYRVDGSLPVALATVGPGVANAVNPFAHALQDQVPLILLGGAISDRAPPQFTHQRIDQLALFAPLAKFAARLEHGSLMAVVEEALQRALTPPYGPVYLDCPVDLMEATATEVRSAQNPPRLDEGRPLAHEREAIAALAEGLRRAERPLAIIGQGALYDPVGARALIEHLQIPALQTYRAKGILPESSPLALAPAGLSPVADALLLPHCRAADLVILLGFDPVEMRSGWNDAFAAADSVWALGPSDPQGLEALWTGRIVASFDALRGVLPVKTLSAAWALASREVRAAHQRHFRPERPEGVAAIFRAVEEQLAERDAVVCVDTGAHRILLSQCWQAEAPGRLLQSTGFCTMACALPLAIGAALADPAKTVVAIVGDGGLLMGLGELATLADSGAKLILIVLDDAAYALIDKKQRERGDPPAGVHLCAVDFQAVAEPFGGLGLRADSPERFAAAFAAALMGKSWTLIHVRVPMGAYDGRF